VRASCDTHDQYCGGRTDRSWTIPPGSGMNPHMTKPCGKVCRRLIAGVSRMDLEDSEALAAAMRAADADVHALLSAELNAMDAFSGDGGNGGGVWKLPEAETAGEEEEEDPFGHYSPPGVATQNPTHKAKTTGDAHLARSPPNGAGGLLLEDLLEDSALGTDGIGGGTLGGRVAAAAATAAAAAAAAAGAAGAGAGSSGLTDKQRSQVLARLASERQSRRARVLSDAAAAASPQQEPRPTAGTAHTTPSTTERKPTGGAAAAARGTPHALLSPPSSVNSSQPQSSPPSVLGGGGGGAQEPSSRSGSQSPESIVVAASAAVGGALVAASYGRVAPPLVAAWAAQDAAAAAHDAAAQQRAGAGRGDAETRERPASAPRERRPSSAPRGTRPAAPPAQAPPSHSAARAQRRSAYRSASAAEADEATATTPRVRVRPRSASAGPRARPPNRHSREAVEAAAAAQAAAELTFRPELATTPRAKATSKEKERTRAKAERDPVKAALEREAALLRLSAPRPVDKWVELKQQEEEEALKQCTFQPKVGRAPLAAGATVTGGAELKVTDRLYLTNQAQLEARELQRRQQEEAALAQCSFRPKTNGRYKTKEEYRPIQDRLAELQKQRAEALARARLAAELCDPELTFKPKLTETSRKIVQVLEARKTLPTAAERLTTCAPALLAAKVRRAEALEAAEAAACPFKPAISETSAKMVELMEACGRNPDFLTRQQEYVELQELKRRAAMAAVDSECTFKPNIGNSELVVTKSAHGVTLFETDAERFERLAVKDKLQLQLKKDNLTAAYLAQFAFKPDVSKSQKAMEGVEATPLNELVQNSRQKLVLDAAKQAVEEAERAECTFRPKINKKKLPARRHEVNVTQPETITKNIEEAKREREEWLAAARAAKEEHELDQCTFKPNLHRRLNSGKGGGGGKTAARVGASPAGSSDRPVVVRGLGRHLELKELARRQKEEQAERERKAWCASSQDPTTKVVHTVPKPFTMSRKDRMERAQARRAAMEAQVRAEAEAELTFHPKTLYAQKKAMINALLEHAEELELDDALLDAVC
jgi:hypothetical protein